MDEIKNETVGMTAENEEPNDMVSVDPAEAAPVPESNSDDTLGTIVAVGIGTLATVGAVTIVTGIPKVCKWVSKKVGGIADKFKKPTDPKAPVEAEFKEVKSEPVKEDETKKEEAPAEEKK